ncbi:MAG: helix-turn-helix domain-containing protein [Burkholderiales bacterium]
MIAKLKMTKVAANVFEDLGFLREEAQILLLRSELMTRIERFAVSSELTQHEAAKRLGVTQPRLHDVLRDKIDMFSLDALVNMLGAVGIRATMALKEAA